MFYDRLKNVCDLRNIALNTVVRATLPSNGVVENWKKGGSPRADAVLKIAKYLNTSSDYLLGLVDDPDPIEQSIFKLDDTEQALIERLRLAEPTIKNAIITMAFSVLPVQNRNAISSSSNDGISYHIKEEEKVSGVNAFLKRVEGEAAAGAPITAVPEEDSFVSVPEKYLDERYFIVRARGDSMEGTIPNGACCVFQRDVPPTDGAIALVQIEGATDQPDDTIKRVYLCGKKIELRSDNPAFAPMFYPAQSVQISGVLVAVLEKSADA